MRMTAKMQAHLYWNRKRRREVMGALYDTSTVSLFSRFAVQPTEARKQRIDTLIKTLKATGLWSKLDCLYITAAHTAQAAQQNWIVNQFNLTEVSAPTFTVDRGYTGNGTTSYLDTGFNPTIAITPKFVQDSGHISAWNRTNRAAADISLMGSRNSTTVYINIIPRAANGSYVGRVNSQSNSILATVADPVGHYIANRSGSSPLQGYKNGVSVHTISVASAAPPNVNIMLLARGVVGAGPDTFAADEISQASIGSSLTVDESAALYSAILAYMQGVGAA